MDLQHKLAEQIAVWMDPDKEEENQEEHILLVYGIELFLNEFLKIMLIFIIGLLMGESKLAIFFMAYVMIAENFQEENTLRVILCALYLQPLPAI